MEVKLVYHKGKPFFQADGEQYSPLAFRSFRPDADNIAEFYGAGIRVMSLLVSGLQCSLDVPYSTYGDPWTGKGSYCFEPIDRQIALFRKHAPEAKLIIMLHLDTRDWWLKEHQGSPHSFDSLSQIAGYEPWRQDTSAYLEAAIAYIEEHYSQLVLGYFLLGGRTTEWFSYCDHGEAHPFKEEAYRRYRNNSGLRIPVRPRRDELELGLFRHPVQQGDALDYWKFHHELVADTVLHFAVKAKEASRRRKLLGVFFGYIMELSGPRLLHEGHLAYDKLFQSDHIDIFCAPSSYMLRQFAGAGGYMNTVDSLINRNKLFILEFDHITHRAPREIEGKRIPGHDSKYADEAETVAVMRRDFAMTMAKRTGIWWFDMFGGWFRSPVMLEEIKRMQEISELLRELPMESAAQVAVLIDADSMLYVDAHSNLNTELLGEQRDGLGRMGAPYDILSLKDLMDSSLETGRYRLLIVLNGFRIDGLVSERLKQLGQEMSILWVYAPGILTDRDISVAAVSQLTGIGVQLLDEPEAAASVTAACGDTVQFGFSRPLAPVLAVHDEAATVIGRYTHSNRPAVACRQLGKTLHFFSGVGNLPGSLLRHIAAMAGVHLYGDIDDPVYVNNCLFGIHAQSEDVRTVLLPDPAVRRARPLFGPLQDAVPVVDRRFEVRLPQGSTQLYLLERNG
ncbi:MAG: hypothetical protein K0R57_1198 [Paenibacillaceae bacterium]|jgi:hypothetical protein|nr:hypothetical protein [Paenibacillaceae bacterium]